MSAANKLVGRLEGVKTPEPWPWKPTRTLEELLPDLVRFLKGEQQVDARLGAENVDVYWAWRCECARGLGRALECTSGR